MGRDRDVGLCWSTLQVLQSPERRHKSLWALKSCALTGGIKVPCLPKLSADGRALGCCNPPQQTWGLCCFTFLHGAGRM